MRIMTDQLLSKNGMEAASFNQMDSNGDGLIAQGEF